MTIKAITIYLGEWNRQSFAYSLRKNDAIALVEASFRFGDPSESQDALGNVWAAGDQDQGWRIVEQEVLATVVAVEVKISGDEDTNHVVWQCPHCKRFYSDDWLSDDCLPILLRCGCQEGENYLLGTTPVAGT